MTAALDRFNIKIGKDVLFASQILIEMDYYLA